LVEIFVVKTDHAALTYLRNFADHNSRLPRLIVSLSQTDFVVRHSPAPKFAHVNALNRHVRTETHKNCIDKETIIQEQSREDFCTKQTPGSYSGNNAFFPDEEGAMYRRQRNGKPSISNTGVSISKHYQRKS
jgi:hypothetical protein